MRRLCIPLLLSYLFSTGVAQDITVRQDSLKTIIATGTLRQQKDTVQSRNVSLKLPRLNPAMDMHPQLIPYQRFTVSTPSASASRLLPPIYWRGVASDYINSKSRTAIATTMPARNLLLHSSATLGLVETPWFGKGTYYILDAGANYTISPALNVGISGGYNSGFGILPFWNAGIDATYMLHPNLLIEGGINYLQTGQNTFGLNQSALLIDLHGRYQLNNDWYLNAYGGMPVSQSNSHPLRPMLPTMHTLYYGGSVEHWFNSTTGVEAGVIWMRDMFTGKMRPQPKLELLFRPKR